jgi:hypothetical protein
VTRPTVVLVEGTSDQVAVETLAARRGHDLAATGVTVVAMGGATEIRRYVERYRGSGVRLSGLCDVREQGFFRRALGLSGAGVDPGAEDLARRGFFVCDRDLEDELIRALGHGGTQRVVEAEGELRSLRRFQDQPAQRGRDTTDQLRRFLGTRSGRKAQYARSLVEALDLSAVPEPLDRLLDHLLAGAPGAQPRRSTSPRSSEPA